MGLRSLLKRDATISVTDWAKLFRPGGTVSYAGNSYQAFQVAASGSTVGLGVYDSNAVVFACATNRMLLFSEARFQYQQLRNGRPGDLFDTTALAILEEPWLGATTRDLLVQAELDVLTAGNSYWVLDGSYLLRLDPARVYVATERGVDDATTNQIGERLAGYAYKENDRTLSFYTPDEIAHYKPHPDQSNRFIGMSWLSPCLPDVAADQSMTQHKTTQLDSGASLNYVVTLDAGLNVDQFKAFVAEYESKHAGPQNAGKTLFLGGGADVKTVGQTFENLNFKATQGAGETRIAACAGVPPVIVGLSEGLASATYSNYGQARRRLVDGTMRPLWGFFASAMESIVAPPTGSRLWYDDRDIPFLREDVKDQAEILARNAQVVRTLTDAGFHPDAVIDAVQASDLNRLVGQHSGLFSVQLQPPSDGTPADNAPLALPAGT